MKTFIQIVISAFLLIPLSASAQNTKENWLNKLDESLAQRNKLESEKISHINIVKAQICKATNDADRYRALRATFDEYKSYSFDSALVYAIKGRELAERMNEPQTLMESQCNLAFCLISGGLLKEAGELLDSIAVPDSVSDEVRILYYDMYGTLYRSMADYVHDDPFYTKYINKSNIYLDSMLLYIEPHSVQWNIHRGSQLMRMNKQAEALDLLRKVLPSSEIDEHEKAKVAAEMAWAYVFIGDEDKAIECFAQSAIYDNESSTREITALYHLAHLLYNQKEYERASKYVHQALNDVQFYNTRLRKIEIGDILPIIEQDRYMALQSQRNLLIGASVLLLILIFVFWFAYRLIHKRNKSLAVARDTISSQLQELQSVNQRLKEADEIKNAFIGRSFYANAEFISKLEKIFVSIDRKIAARQYEDLRSMTKLSKINNDRDDMFDTFDQTFLKLFPDFVKKYNDLFEEKDRKMPANEYSLTSEMRIFALIRLGITDSERIAMFLNYSVHTVNTYKTRIKNRSIVDNDRFEQLIMEF